MDERTWRPNTKILAVLFAGFLTILIASSVAASQFQTYSFAVHAYTSQTSALNPTTPIQHIIFIIQENHAFDNLFGTFPGLPPGFALNLSTCMTYTINQTKPTPCEKPFNADNDSAVQQSDFCHTADCAVKAYDNGRMDGFYAAHSGDVHQLNVMAYYDGRALPYYWDYASYYTLDYNFFSSAMSYSEPNHLYLVAANSQKTEVDTYATPWNLSYPEIGTAMTNAGVSWGYFQYNWNDSKDCTGSYHSGESLATGPFDGFWAGEAQFTKVQNTLIECSSLGNINDFENALRTNTLPQVSYVIPEPSVSDHPGQSTLKDGQLYVASIIGMIESSAVWPSSATFLTWDDWGGYYDSVAPTQLDEFGDGFRVPLIAISPYSIAGGLIGGCVTGQTVACAPEYSYYNNFTGVRGTTNQNDFSAFLSTIEYNWGVKPIAIRDAEEPNLFFMLNFSQKPLAPLFLSSNYSDVTYPLSFCPSSCSHVAATSLASQLVYYAPPPSWTEPLSEAAANAGNGDPDD